MGSRAAVVVDAACDGTSSICLEDASSWMVAANLHALRLSAIAGSKFTKKLRLSFGKNSCELDRTQTCVQSAQSRGTQVLLPWIEGYIGET
jgi:hypothetical protein